MWGVRGDTRLPRSTDVIGIVANGETWKRAMCNVLTWVQNASGGMNIHETKQVTPAASRREPGGPRAGLGHFPGPCAF